MDRLASDTPGQLIKSDQSVRMGVGLALINITVHSSVADNVVLLRT
jgi:hypothetical protein